MKEFLKGIVMKTHVLRNEVLSENEHNEVPSEDDWSSTAEPNILLTAHESKYHRRIITYPKPRYVIRSLKIKMVICFLAFAIGFLNVFNLF